MAILPHDEPDLVQAWTEFGQAAEVELLVCISSCLRRGLLDETEADRYQKPNASIAPGFTISGLGQLIDACLESDRVMSFGG